MKRKFFLLLFPVGILVLVFTLLPFARKKTVPGQPWEASDFILGTIVTIKVYEPPPKDFFEEIFEEIRGYEALLSSHIGTSDISRLNRAAGVAPVQVDPLVLAVIQEGQYYSRFFEGRFDITVGPLVNLWSIGDEDSRIPSPEEIAEVLPLIGHRDVVVDEKAGTVFLRRRGMEIDVGAIAKGFIADRVAETLRAAEIGGAIINLGGNILALGAKPGDLSFRIGIQNPRESQGQPMGILELKNLSVVSSGDYERFFLQGGRRYHHILDTATGYPTDTGLISVTIVCTRATDGDGLSTSLFTLGLDAGYRLITSMEGTEAVFIAQDLSVYLTPGLEEIYTPVDTNFTIKTWKKADTLLPSS